MKFSLECTVSAGKIPLSHKRNLILTGSCFSDEMALKMRSAGFSVLSNPVGTIFHPLVLARFIEYAISKNTQFSIFKQEEFYFSYETSRLLFEKSEAELQQRLEAIQLSFLENLKTASHLFVTFGSAWAYIEHESRLLVANCHKQPSSLYTKKLSPVEELFSAWDRLLPL